IRSNRSNNRLNLSSHAKVRSTRIRNTWMASLKRRLRPRFGVLRLRGFSLILGMRPALKMHLRLCAESKPPSRLREAPLSSIHTSLATSFNAFRPSGNKTHVGLIDRSHRDRREDVAMIVDDGNDLIALLMFVARVANAIAPFLATVLVPSPWSTVRSSCFSAARCRTLATNACQSDPSSAHFAKTL